MPRGDAPVLTSAGGGTAGPGSSTSGAGRPWPLLDDRTRGHYRQLVVDGIDGAGRRRQSPASDY
jgi:hypothetical protein